MITSDILIVPGPGLEVDGLADTADDLQRAQVVQLDVVGAETTQEADHSGHSIELSQLVFLNHLPVTRGHRVDRGRLEDHDGDAI